MSLEAKRKLKIQKLGQEELAIMSHGQKDGNMVVRFRDINYGVRWANMTI